MYYQPRTLEILFETYGNSHEAIEKLTGIDVNNLSSQINIAKISNKLYCLDEGINLITDSSNAEHVYDLVISKISFLLNDKITSIILNYKDIVSNYERLISDLTTQIIDKLPSVVKMLCYFDARSRQNLKIAGKNIFESYPVLVHAIDLHFHHSLSILETFIQRLLDDSDLLVNKFNLEKLIIKKIMIGLGDFHEIGEGVIRCELKEKSLIYKTRSADNEALVSKLLEIIKDEESSYMLGIPKFINRGEYSWHEYIQFQDCNCVNDVKEFYKKSGASIAFFYAIGGVDFHYENIICSNNKPYFIDLECVFSGPVKFDILSESILSTCIIPPLCGSPVEQFICGLGIRDSGEGHTYESTFQLNGKGHKKQIANYYNRPIDFISQISQKDIKQEIINGFKDMVYILNKYKDAIALSISQANSIHGRIILRPSKFYADTLAIANHPRYSSVPFYRDCFIACAISQSNLPDDIVKSEFASLKNGMIPTFYTDVINKKCYSKKHDYLQFDERYRDLDKVIEHMCYFCSTDNDMKYHLALISVSLNVLFPEINILSNEKENNQSMSISKVIAFMIEEKFSYKGQDIIVNIIKDEKNSYKINELDSSLYYGYGGSLFLQILDYLHGPNESKKKKIYTLYELCHEINQKEAKLRYGVFEQNGSLLYLNFLIFKYVGDKCFLNNFIDSLERIIDIVKSAKKTSTDVMSGISGLLIVCCRMYEFSSNEKVKNAISLFSEMIISSAINCNDNQISWGKKLTGFAHGNAGVIYALLLANEILKKPLISDIAIKALLYENSFKINSGWKDLRAKNKEIDFNSWCHGSPGIYLSRQAILDECPSICHNISALIHEDIEHYLSSSHFREANTELSLCHGVFGNSIINNNPERFFVDLHNDTDEKSLMSGKAGAAYTNLYFSYTGENFPNILLLK